MLHRFICSAFFLLPTNFSFEAAGVSLCVFSVIGIVAFIVQRTIPFMLLGTVIQKQKNISEITMALDRMRLPRGVILSIAVMFRYFPAIKDDFFIIIDSMKLKGLYTSKCSALLHPIRTMEFVLVPMLFKSLKTAEELSCAALVKGIKNTGKKTSYFDVKLRPVDAVFSLAAYMRYIKHCGIRFSKSRKPVFYHRCTFRSCIPMRKLRYRKRGNTRAAEPCLHDIHYKRLTIFDEPTSGLDYGSNQ